MDGGAVRPDDRVRERAAGQDVGISVDTDDGGGRRSAGEVEFGAAGKGRVGAGHDRQAGTLVDEDVARTEAGGARVEQQGTREDVGATRVGIGAGQRDGARTLLVERARADDVGERGERRGGIRAGGGAARSLLERVEGVIIDGRDRATQRGRT